MPSGNRYLGSAPGGYVLRKLPEVTLLFWLLKTVAVTLGETSGDLLGITCHLGYLATAVLFVAFLLAVAVAQVRAGRFHPALYWAVILGTSMVGTEISDFLNRGPGDGSAQNGVGYGWGAVLLSCLLGLVFLVWRATGQSYDVESITSRRGEILYWIAILISNTLGTSTGDYLSDETGLGFRGAFALLAAVMALLIAAHYFTAISGTLLFWIAFVLTRPLGAAGGDALTKPASDGGLGWGTAWGSAALVVLLTLLIAAQVTRLRRATSAPLRAPADGNLV